jgi:hypothetical protein
MTGDMTGTFPDLELQMRCSEACQGGWVEYLGQSSEGRILQHAQC